MNDAKDLLPHLASTYLVRLVDHEVASQMTQHARKYYASGRTSADPREVQRSAALSRTGG